MGDADEEQAAMLFDEDALRRLISEAVRDAVREELSRDPERAEYLSVVSAARVAEVAPGTIRAWISAGRLRGCRAGRELRVRRADLDALLAGGGAAAASPQPEQAAVAYLRARRR